MPPYLIGGNLMQLRPFTYATAREKKKGGRGRERSAKVRG